MTPEPTPPTPAAPGPLADHLTRAQASAFLEGRGIRMKPTTLARAYSTGSGGPPCRHIRNKPYYPLDLLAAWAEAQISAPVASSSERQRLRREARRQEATHGR
ncbi:hypothetical protein BZG35_17065 [Brevundimonas sp. LM2]|uniref:hypothetical protein n=1 Tax=Brevundimonas sp. LM2 TaxID=1938605 RepID=UPI000984016D|nr:hypothetical protein [Brevundimonas sp. LM2]AQR63166.1 hypothetical protein BZG35_17065 [Brevundimonas sp. LM2]